MNNIKLGSLVLVSNRDHDGDYQARSFVSNFMRAQPGPLYLVVNTKQCYSGFISDTTSSYYDLAKIDQLRSFMNEPDPDPLAGHTRQKVLCELQWISGSVRHGYGRWSARAAGRPIGGRFALIRDLMPLPVPR
jgi:hypothetical protein